MTETAEQAGRSAASETLIDWAHLERQTAGDADLVQELFALFCEQSRRLMPGLRDGAGSREQRADLVHTLKGSALGIGASLVAEQAARAEDALRKAASEPHDDVAALMDAVERTIAAIETR